MSFDVRRYPLLPLSLSAMTGVVCSLFFDIDTIVWRLLLGAAITFTLLSLVRLGPNRFTFAMVAFSVIALTGLRSADDLAREGRRQWNEYFLKEDTVRVIGVVQLVESASLERGRFVIRTTHVGKNSAPLSRRTIGIEVRLDSLAGILPGDQVIAIGEPGNERKTLTRSVSALLSRVTSRIAGTLICDHVNVSLIERPAVSVARIAYSARHYVETEFEKHLDADAAAVCSALLMGDQSDFSREFRESLRVTGLSHIFALSGMNTGLIISLVWLISGLLWLPRQGRYLLCLVFTTAFLIFGLATPSLVRAALMTAIFIVGRMLSRPVGIVNLVSGAALIELLWQPLHLTAPGFFLSYLSVIGIASTYLGLRALAESQFPRLFISWIMPLTEAGLLTASSQIGTFPALAALFGRIPLLGAAANVIAVPMFAVILLAALAFLTLNALSPALAAPLGASIAALVSLVSNLAVWTSKLPLSGLTISAPLVVVIAAGSLSTAAIMIGLSRRRFSFVLIGLFAAANLAIWFQPSTNTDPAEIVFFDVHNGDAALIHVDGKIVVVDDGPRIADWTFASAIAGETRRRGAGHIDLLILTHPDNDHIGGSAELFSLIEVERVVVNGDSAQSRVYYEYRLGQQNAGLVPDTLVAGHRIELGPNSTITVLAPIATFEPGEYSENQRSIVFRLDVDNSSALFTADIDSTIEHYLLGTGALIEVDLLKVAHHGSTSGSCAEFLRNCAPEYALISAGERNVYGHPSLEVLDRLSSQNISIAVTGRSGTITFRSESDTWVPIPNQAQIWAERLKLL